MKTVLLLVLLLGLVAACGGDDATDVAADPDVFHFDSGGAHHIQGFGAWRVTASRDGSFQATHVVRGKESVYKEVVLDPTTRAILWATIDAAKLDDVVASERAGVPDESQLTLRLERSGKPPLELTLWANDARAQLGLQPLLQELRIRIFETYGVKPVF